jgi:hypothetical protein
MQTVNSHTHTHTHVYTCTGRRIESTRVAWKENRKLVKTNQEKSSVICYGKKYQINTYDKYVFH